MPDPSNMARFRGATAADVLHAAADWAAEHEDSIGTLINVQVTSTAEDWSGVLLQTTLPGDRRPSSA